MSRVQPMQTAYNGGELSPLMMGRADHEVWAVGLKEMVGFCPRPQGPMEASPGFEYVETAAGPCRLIPFEPYVTQGYVIEASDQLLRFYTNDVLLESGGSPVEVVTPYSFAQVRELWHEHSNDVLYLFHGDVKQRLLERTAAAAFSLTELEFENGPFLDRNADESLTLSFNGVTGSGITVTASAALFAATDVGRLIEVEAEDLSDIPSWEPGITVTLGQLLQWDGRVYQVTGGGTAMRTGTVQPVHTRGVEWDGIGQGKDLNEKDAGGVELSYMHDMFGRLKITGYTNATTVTATVTRRLPLQLATSYAIEDYLRSGYTPSGSYDGTGTWTSPGSGSYTAGTWRWRLGAFSDTTGWPSAGIISDQRLILFKDNSIYASVAGSLHDFDRLNEYGEVSIDQAFSLTLDDPSPIRWAAKGADVFIGTENAEYVLRQAAASQPLGPGNTALVKQDERGGTAMRPEMLGGRPIFQQRGKRKLLHMMENSYGRYVPDDMLRYADHFGNSALVEVAWQREPLQLLWAVRADGELVCADYLPEESVLGWWHRPLGGGLLAESICSITAPDGLSDQLWISASNGTDRFVMVLDKWRLPGERPDLPIMFDAALTYNDPNNPISELSMPHLAGETVEVVANGAWLGEYTVAGDGTIDLGTVEAGTAVAGYAYPAYVVLLPWEAGGDNGPAQFKTKRPSRLSLRLEESLGLRVTCNGNVQSDIGNLQVGDLLDGAIEPISGDLQIDIIGTWDSRGELRIERYAPFPGAILGHAAVLEVSQR